MSRSALAPLPLLMSYSSYLVYDGTQVNRQKSDQNSVKYRNTNIFLEISEWERDSYISHLFWKLHLRSRSNTPVGTGRQVRLRGSWSIPICPRTFIFRQARFVTFRWFNGRPFNVHFGRPIVQKRLLTRIQGSLGNYGTLTFVLDNLADSMNVHSTFTLDVLSSKKDFLLGYKAHYFNERTFNVHFGRPLVQIILLIQWASIQRPL